MMGQIETKSIEFEDYMSRFLKGYQTVSLTVRS